MGLFSKKREDSIVTPMQEDRPEVGLVPKPVPKPEPESDPEPEAPAPRVAEAAPSRSEPTSKGTHGPEFGIQSAMELMRKLPPDNIPLVVSVVKTTLESLDIDVESIIEDAKIKRAKIADRIANLEAEIADLQEEVAARRQEITALQDDASETKSVQERLQLATGSGREAPVVPSKPELSAPLLRPPGG